jgi:hypothetical protein
MTLTFQFNYFLGDVISISSALVKAFVYYFASGLKMFYLISPLHIVMY